ncbi:VIT1/CCC1 transporter family protein [uncultured Desulfuromonas sp.]|uniref:VIT1/CCC1 transporter family protein n=1 Tax=uncultured Desulfuromonas sp. TaxID=181013 RepID=UPI002AAC09FC|nr:VIT1/CCC1 transporter family protein [uncultured Desulfuromonas sp.]
MNEKTRNYLISLQKNEITEYHIYTKLAKSIRSKDNAVILQRVGNEERRHYEIWKNHTKTDVAPDRVKVWLYYLISLIFGFTFGMKLMERGEVGAQTNYKLLSEEFPEAAQIAAEEKEHEMELLALLDEERLHYTGSIVLGLNDALVELTGVLAGLTLALQNTRLIALAGLITGIAASLSMACSEYLSMKNSNGEEKHPVKGAAYTGIAYVSTVFLLILPFLVFEHYFVCLFFSLVAAVAIIAGFNYYISIAEDLTFKDRFREMAVLSLGVAGLSFLIGYVVRVFLGVDI